MKPRTELFETFAVQGMDLRDYFASKALQGMLVGVEEPSYRTIAFMAYKMADAMIEERGEK